MINIKNCLNDYKRLLGWEVARLEKKWYDVNYQKTKIVEINDYLKKG